MMWWKKIASLQARLKDAEAQLQNEQRKLSRLAGFFARLQIFGVSAAGQVPSQDVWDAVLDSVHALLEADQAVFFRPDPDSSDLLPAAGRGISSDALAQLRVRPGEGALGRAAQNLKTILEKGELIVPLRSQARCSGLLWIAKPAKGSFDGQAQELAALLAAQAALILEGHGFYENLARLRDQAVASLARAMEAKDLTTHSHSERTRALVRAVVQDIPLPDMLIQQIELGAFLHDIGKIGIDDAILKKAGSFTAEEYAVMKNHPAIGFKIVQPIPFLKAASAIILYHQEWYNGAGYPEGLAGEEIPLGARIVQIIDAWDAMTSNRPYRQAMSKPSAMAELRRQAGTQFDPKLVDVFLRVLDRLEREGIPTTEQGPMATVENGK